MANTNTLGTSITLPHSKRVVPTRFLKAAMSERLATWDAENDLKRGRPTPELIRMYEEWGKGRYGIILSGNIQVHRAHLEAAGNAIIDPDIPEDYTEDFAKMAKAGKADGALMIAQVSHAGRQVSTDIQKNPVSASDVKLPDTWGMTFNKPTPLTTEGIKDIVNRFAHAAVVLHRAGWDGIQAHSAHGYILAQFLSPKTNKRTDKYGGSLENRSRIIFEIIDEIRRRVNDPSFSLGIKLNSADFSEGGLEEDECEQLIYKLEESKLDWIELSGVYHLYGAGTYEHIAFSHRTERTKAREGFFLEFAERVRPHLKTLVLSVTGGFRSASAMTKAVEECHCHIVGLGRPVCGEPYLPRDILEGKSMGARSTKLPENVMIENIAAAKQIGQISRGEPITLFTTQEEVDELLKSRGLA